MTTAILEPKTAEFDVDDVEYLRHGDKPLLARIFKPRGAGPFPAMVECHGGAWCMSDRTTEKLRHQYIGQRGSLSRLGAGHQLCGALGQAERARA
jgi:acetyl esterase